MRLKEKLLTLSLCISAVSVSAGRTPMTLWYDEPATVWMTSSLPVGNGEIGATFMGGVAHEQVQFNDKTLWTGSSDIRGSYQNMGDLMIDFDHGDNYTDYRRELSLDDAIGCVSYTIDGINYLREYFASNPDSVIVVRLSTPGSKGKISFTAELKDGRDALTTVSDNVMTIKNKLDLLSYEAQAEVKADGGSVSAVGNAMKVSGADAVTITISGATNFNLASPDYTCGDDRWVHDRVTARMAKARKKSYKDLKNTHLKDYGPLFARVELDLDAPMPDCTTDILVREHKDNAYLDMLYFQYGRYLMLGSSRGGQLPSNLQGLWNNVNNPAWEADYHSNINVQMNYWPTEVANLSECYQPYINYVTIEASKDNGSWQKIARKENCRGWTIHTQNNIFGYSDWMINRPANAWYCTHLWDHYAYTLDRDYLRDTAYPVLKLTCQYWFDRLKENSDGLLVAPEEWSPEHGPVEDGVAYAQQLVYALFDQTLQAAGILGINDDFTAELNDKFSRLDNGLHIGSWGQLKEWTIEEDEQGNHQRHLSHLIALYPCDYISDFHDSKYADAARVALDSRGDGATGWSRAWKVACWARLHDAERAYRLLKQAQNLTDITYVTMDDNAGGVYENLFCAHPSFQIDGNFGATAGIAEMMLQNSLKGVHLIPALPKAWADGHFKGLKAKNNFVFDAGWQNGALKEVTVHSGSGRECAIYFPDCAPESVKEGKRKINFTRDASGTLRFPTKPGKTYRIVFRNS